MKRTVFVFGIIAGLITMVWLIAFAFLGVKEGMEKGMVLGFAAQFMALSLVFVGIKSFRDKYNGGIITFGKAFLVGLYISIVAGSMYTATWTIENKYFLPEFADKYADYEIADLKKQKLPEAELKEKLDKMEKFRENYKNPAFVALVTFGVEFLPAGLLFSLVSAAILFRKKLPEPKPAIS